MAITTWTSESMNWAAPNPMEKKYWAALNLAYAERCAAISQSSIPASNTGFNLVLEYDPNPSASLTADYMFDCSVITGVQFGPLSGWNNAIGSHFVNYKKYGGNYAGTKDYAPLWTVTEFLKEACSGGEYITLASLRGMSLNSSRAQQYLIQCYRMLNLCRWRMGTCGAYDQKFRQTLNPKSTWAAALTEFNALPILTNHYYYKGIWDSIVISNSTYFIGANSYHNAPFSTYLISSAGYNKVFIPFSQPGSSGTQTWYLYDAYTKSCELWMSFTMISAGGVIDLSSCPFGLSTTGCTYIATISQTGAPSGTDPTASFGGYNTSCPPASMPIVDNQTCGWQTAMFFLVKWDVVGGFNFIATV